MNHAQLKAFHAVAKYGGITSAAKSLGITQPAVTLQIQALEKKYNTPLFNRQGHTITLTQAGLMLHKLSSRYFMLEEEAHRLLNSIMQMEAGKLRIASDIPHRIFPLTAEFREQYTDVEISVSILSPIDITDHMADRLVDVAVSGIPIAHDSLECHEIGSEPLSVTLPVQHSLSRPKPITFEDLKSEKILIYKDGNGISSLDQKIVSAGSFTPEQIIFFDNRDMIQEAVAHELGIAFLSKHEIGHDRRLTSITLEDCRLTRKEYLIFHEEKQSVPVVSAFRKLFFL